MPAPIIVAALAIVGMGLLAVAMIILAAVGVPVNVSFGPFP